MLYGPHECYWISGGNIAFLLIFFSKSLFTSIILSCQHYISPAFQCPFWIELVIFSYIHMNVLQNIIWGTWHFNTIWWNRLPSYSQSTRIIPSKIFQDLMVFSVNKYHKSFILKIEAHSHIFNFQTFVFSLFHHKPQEKFTWPYLMIFHGNYIDTSSKTWLANRG